VSPLLLNVILISLKRIVTIAIKAHHSSDIKIGMKESITAMCGDTYINLRLTQQKCMRN
jgi:hypothetical protein